MYRTMFNKYCHCSRMKASLGWGLVSRGRRRTSMVTIWMGSALVLSLNLAPGRGPGLGRRGAFGPPGSQGHVITHSHMYLGDGALGRVMPIT